MFHDASRLFSPQTRNLVKLEEGLGPLQQWGVTWTFNSVPHRTYRLAPKGVDSFRGIMPGQVHPSVGRSAATVAMYSARYDPSANGPVRMEAGAKALLFLVG